jgi:hypothetical protein
MMLSRFTRRAVIASALALSLAGCSSLPGISADPTEWFNVDFFNNKKKLPGERHPLFPDGVPGVTRGVPSDLVKGYQPPAVAQDQPDANAPGSAQNASAQQPGEPLAIKQAAVEEEKPAARPKPKSTAKSTAKPKHKARPKPKPAPKVAAKPEPAEEEASQPAPAPTRPQRSASQVQWPDPPAPTQTRQQPAVQWPDPPAPKSGPAAVQWPDPPPTQ